ncbi:protein POLR1D isoform X2 [Amia ocellicauda]|uniref:protein POLR1D isoform X2 n=1 Tax=Amia ocellicauda TaxID=2972642 RepID=UPI003463AA17
MAEEKDLERRAVEELLNEAKRGKIRAETMGPAGWMKCPLRGANKRFLMNTLRNTVSPGHSPQRQGGTAMPEHCTSWRRREEEDEEEDRGARFRPSTHRQGRHGSQHRSRSPTRHRDSRHSPPPRPSRRRATDSPHTPPAREHAARN